MHDHTIANLAAPILREAAKENKMLTAEDVRQAIACIATMFKMNNRRQPAAMSKLLALSPSKGTDKVRRAMAADPRFVSRSALLRKEGEPAGTERMHTFWTLAPGHG